MYFLASFTTNGINIWSKLSLESIKIPSKVSFVLVLSEASPIDASAGVLELKSKCHFPGLALR